MAGKLFLHSFDVFAIKLCFMYLNRLAPISNNSNKSLQPPPSILLPPSVDTSIPSTRVGILFFNCDTPPPHSSWRRLLSHIGTPFSSWICLLSSAVSWLIYGNTVSCYIWIISACSKVKRWTWITKYQNIESRILAVLSHYSSAAEKWWERKNDIKRVSNSQDEGEEKGCGNHPP